jgi:tetratricopeptide (TPR) repeat protein
MGRVASLVEELRQRRVARALVAYGAGVAAVLQGTDMVFAALALPDLAYRIIVIAAIAGFPLVAVLAWVYDLTAQGLRRAVDITPEEGRAPVPLSRYLQLVGAFTVAALIVLSTAGAVSHIRYPSSDDGRVGLAIFPLRATGQAGDEWSEGAADLLATALEGTPSLRVVDPWSLWGPLRPEAGAAARVPDPGEAEEIADRSGAHRFLLGSVVPSGDRLELAFRVYRVGRSEPLDAFTVSATADGMADAVRQAALRVLARVWGPLRPPDVPAELDFDATQSPESLKAYLAAKEAMRRGMVDSANTAIDHALALDSTFVLGIVEAIGIKSWGLTIRGQPYTGFVDMLARAERFEAGLNERSRLRLEASRASVRTDGPTAIAATARILELDPLDYDANAKLEYYRRAYGWQLAPPEYGSPDLAEMVVRLDSTQLPALAVREWWAVSLRDTTDERAQLRRLIRADTSGVLGRSTVRSLRALLADSTAFEEMLPGLAALPRDDFIQLVRHLRSGNPTRYRRLLDLVAAPDAPNHVLAFGEVLRSWITRGWATRVDSVLDAGAYPEERRIDRATIEMLLVTADLDGLQDPVAGRRAIASLTRYVPVDSAMAYWGRRPVWSSGWLRGAWEAQLGDTTVARRWIDVIPSFPAGGTPDDYRGALRSDIEARLAARRGDRDRAVALERTAMKRWTIHADNDYESSPSPQIRLNLALLLLDAGQPEDAEALLSSLVPPVTWLGPVTVRALYELGVLEDDRGDTAAAAAHLRRLLSMLEDPGPAAAAWAERARARLAALPSG